MPERREYFYVGGEYAVDEKGNHLFHNQMYVEKLSPESGATQAFPLVFFHGGAQSGTPDGTPGWAQFFVAQGYECYISDQPSRGRSPWTPGKGDFLIYPAEHVQARFSATERQQLWPQASLHTQWPGSGLMGDPYFDAYYASCVPYRSSATDQETTTQSAAAALLDRIGKPVILVGHSQGGIMAWLVADARPGLVRTIVSIEPSGPPFSTAVFSSSPERAYGLTNAPLVYDPPVTDPARDLIKKRLGGSPDGMEVNYFIQAEDPAPRQLINLKNIPVLLVTGEASYHAVYDWCTVKFLEQAGVQVRHVELAKEGIKGNGHMMFLERNSDEIANLLHKSLKDLT
ncbi:MAG: hypothetical protein Q9227_005416 [Pyrenula ochraceoflavens]